jgi:hypothetical protein
MNASIIITALVLWVVAWGLATWIGDTKNRRSDGLWLGFSLGWIGVIIVMFLPKKDAKEVWQAQAQFPRDAKGHQLTPGFEHALGKKE